MSESKKIFLDSKKLSDTDLEQANGGYLLFEPRKKDLELAGIDLVESNLFKSNKYELDGYELSRQEAKDVCEYAKDMKKKYKNEEELREHIRGKWRWYQRLKNQQ